MAMDWFQYLLPYPSPAPSNDQLWFDAGPLRPSRDFKRAGHPAPSLFLPMASPYRRPSPRALSPSPAASPASPPPEPTRSPARANPGPGPTRTAHKHTKHRLRDIDRKRICEYHLENPSARQEDIGAEFSVERSTISKILKDKERWLTLALDDETAAADAPSKRRPSKFPEIEDSLRKSLEAWTGGGTNITDHLIRAEALAIAARMGIGLDRFKGSAGWVENFKHRHDIRRGEWLGASKHPWAHRVKPPGPTALLQPYASSVPDRRPHTVVMPTMPAPATYDRAPGPSHPPWPATATAPPPFVLDPSLVPVSPRSPSDASASPRSSDDDRLRYPDDPCTPPPPPPRAIPDDPSAIQHSPDGYGVRTSDYSPHHHPHDQPQHQPHHDTQQQQQHGYHPHYEQRDDAQSLYGPGVHVHTPYTYHAPGGSGDEHEHAGPPALQHAEMHPAELQHTSLPHTALHQHALVHEGALHHQHAHQPELLHPHAHVDMHHAHAHQLLPAPTTSVLAPINPPRNPLNDPTLQEAEDAMTTVLAFLDRAPDDLITNLERKALTDVKRAMFQYASGMEYVRSPVTKELMLGTG